MTFQQEPTCTRKKKICIFQIRFEEFLSKTKSFTGGHVSETEQKTTINMKEGYKGQSILFLFLVQ